MHLNGIRSPRKRAEACIALYFGSCRRYTSWLPVYSAILRQKAMGNMWHVWFSGSHLHLSLSSCLVWVRKISVSKMKKSLRRFQLLLQQTVPCTFLAIRWHCSLKLLKYFWLSLLNQGAKPVEAASRPNLSCIRMKLPDRWVYCLKK